MKRAVVLVLGLAVLATACGASVNLDGYGGATASDAPLAVFEGSNESTDGEAFEGVLTIADGCTFLHRSDGEPLLIAWPSEPTMWSSTEAKIGFTNPDGVVVAAADGDAVLVGGGEYDAVTTGWLEAPAVTCPDGEWIAVSTLEANP